jgi:penicillin amidase
MGYMLSVNYKQELEHYQIIKLLGEQAKVLFPEYHVNDSFPTIYEVEEASPFSFEELHKLASFAPSEFNGSNNWVISGEHTEPGFPMIANDPHLGIAIPSVWYQTHLNLKEDFHSIGVTVPGVHGVVLGHNEHMAWGVSALIVDQQDLFLEQVHPENPQLYLYDGAWEETTVIEEVITIKGEDEPHIERVDVTRNGPIINKIVDDGPYQAISLNWTGYTAGQELKGILKINRSRNAIEFNEALDGFVTPALSWVFADHDGNIGYRGQSLIPIRRNQTAYFLFLDGIQIINGRDLFLMMSFLKSLILKKGT